jgi:hypothetical protein
MGNVIPMLFWLPPLAAGLLLMATERRISVAGVSMLVVATVVGWLALNQFGLFNNGKMRRQLERILTADGAKLPSDRAFVGYSSPKYRGVLDAHEDVGFLCFLADRLLFLSETRTVEVMRVEVNSVGFRANPHSLVGLGRWISVDGVRDDKPIRLLIEPRDRKTMLANRRRGKLILSRIKRWLKETCESAETPETASPPLQ